MTSRPDTKLYSDTQTAKQFLSKLKKHLTQVDDKRRYELGSPSDTGAKYVMVTYQQLTEWIFLCNCIEDAMKNEGMK